MTVAPTHSISAHWPTLLAAIAISVTSAACSRAETSDGPATAAPALNSVEPPTIAVALSRLPEFLGMRQLVATAGMADELADSRGTITLLAARDTAFAQLPPEARTRLFSGVPRSTLEPVVRSMMVARIISSEELRTRIIEGNGSFSTPSMAGPALTFRLNGDQIIVTGASGVSANMGNSALTTGNGTIYILDRWIGPAG